MQSDLIVMAFAEETAALKARQALKRMRSSPFLGLQNLVVVTRDAVGKVAVDPQCELPARRPSPSVQVCRTLVEGLFCSGLGDGPQPDPGAGVQKLVCAGLDEIFVREVASALRPSSSLILTCVWQESLVDPRQLLDALGQLEGTPYHTTVPLEVEEALLRVAQYE